MKTITAHQPVVAFEHHHGSLEYGTEPRHIWELLVTDRQGQLEVVECHLGGVRRTRWTNAPCRRRS